MSIKIIDDKVIHGLTPFQEKLLRAICSFLEPYAQSGYTGLKKEECNIIMSFIFLLFKIQRNDDPGVIDPDLCATITACGKNLQDQGTISCDEARALSRAIESSMEVQSERQKKKYESLTKREQEVLFGIAEGKANKEIGVDLEIERRTVETHRESLMDKLGIHSVAGLTKFALTVGLTSLNPK